MPTFRIPRCAATAARAFLLLTIPALGRAQLAGSARVALDAATTRDDGGGFNQYGVGAGAYPFVGEHVQLGLAPSYNLATSHDGPSSRGYGVGATANYVFGGGARWRGYAGGYAARAWTRTDAFSTPNGVAPRYARQDDNVGAQAGALFFFDPAVALRGELRYRTPASGPGRGYGNWTALVRLDPYLFGRAGEAAPGATGLGTVDLDGYASYFDVPFDRSHEWSAGARVAPYLTRWAQVGVDASGFRYSDYSGGGAYVARGFGRLYLPLTVRTQPFAEGFVQTGTYASVGDGRLSGGTLGVRQMLSARVGLDVGVRRLILPRVTLPGGYEYRHPNQTGLVLGLATRVGRTRS